MNIPEIRDNFNILQTIGSGKKESMERQGVCFDEWVFTSFPHRV